MSILTMQIFSMIRCQSLHNKTFWLVSNEEKHLKATNLLGNLWFKHCGLWPVTSCQFSQGHIKGGLCLVSQDDIHHGKILGSQGSPTEVLQQWQGVSGCWVVELLLPVEETWLQSSAVFWGASVHSFHELQWLPIELCDGNRTPGFRGPDGV